MIRARLGILEFLGGLQVSFNANSILVIVGPNNTGKSATLAAIRGILSGEAHVPSALTNLTLLKETTVDEIKTEIQALKNSQGAYQAPGALFFDVTLNNWWSEDSSKIGLFLTKEILSDLPTKTRLHDCDPAKIFDVRTPYSAEHPFQRMYREPELEAATSFVFRRAFKRDLVLHRAAGSIIPMYVGARPPIEAGEDRISLSYLDRVEKLDPLETQGDGVRSFVSIAARVITENRPILLIDEPEAFLHPPQARLIAESVASFGGGRQTIVATHSSDILQGLLTDHAERVSVIRLTRADSQPTVNYLETGKVAELWRDPILRFSNILDGLFHDGVVVTEGDADCRFYEAIANVAVDVQFRPDIHYTYSGGKDRLPVVIAALRGVRVPVATVVDFDVLNNDQPLRRIVEAHGGDWNVIEKDWLAVKAAIESKAAFLGGDVFRADVTAELKKYGKGEVVPKAILGEIRRLTRRASPWDSVKDAGLAAIPAGEPTVTAKRLLQALQKIGIFVAPNGQMEGFCRSVGSHGPRWVETVLQKDIAADAELQEARAFVRQVVEFLRC
jgi:energy-coupling factor transporter ATP-binding protein EcfA2